MSYCSSPYGGTQTRDHEISAKHGPQNTKIGFVQNFIYVYIYIRIHICIYIYVRALQAVIFVRFHSNLAQKLISRIAWTSSLARQIHLSVSKWRTLKTLKKSYLVNSNFFYIFFSPLERDVKTAQVLYLKYFYTTNPNKIADN